MMLACVRRVGVEVKRWKTDTCWMGIQEQKPIFGIALGGVSESGI